MNELELDLKNDENGWTVSSPKILIKSLHELSYPSYSQTKLSPCGRYYSIEYTDGGFFEIYVNNHVKSKGKELKSDKYESFG